MTGPVINLAASPVFWPVQVHSVMLFPGVNPGDTERRQQFLEALGLGADVMRNGRRQSPVHVTNHLIVHAHELVSGKVCAGHVCGDVLKDILVAVRAGTQPAPSLNRTFCKFSTAPRPVGTSLSEIRRAWNRYKPAAHLWAMGEPPSPDFDEEKLLAWLASAEMLRRLGEAYRPPKARGPILAPAKTWRLPPTLTLPPVEWVNVED